MSTSHQGFHKRAILFCLILGSTSALALTQTPLASFQRNQRRSAMTRLHSNSDEQDDSGNIKFQVQTWNPLRLAVLKLGMTEPAWTSPWNYQKKQGIFTCAYCGKELFETNGKYDSGSGWPSFWRTAKDGAVSLQREMDGRVECQCSRCGSHLGHVFMDGPSNTTVPIELLSTAPATDPRGRNQRLPRYCINGASLRFTEGASDDTSKE